MAAAPERPARRLGVQPRPRVRVVVRVGRIVRITARTLRDALVPRRLPHGERATLIDHLEELRHRMLLLLVAFGLAFAACYLAREQIIGALAAPLPADGPTPVTFGVAEPFLLSLRLSAIAAGALVLPLALWHGWAFCAPAFAPEAQRSVRWFGIGGAVLFAAGAAFGYLVALPSALGFLVHFDDHLYRVELRAREYYDFAALAVFAIAAVFELPILLLGLVRFGVLSAAQLRRHRRTGYAVVALVAVLLPGVDPVLTALEALPLLVLYEGTVVIATVCERRWRAGGTMLEVPDTAAAGSGARPARAA